MARYDNIFLAHTATSSPYTPPPQRGGDAVLPHRSSRKAHSDKLILQFKEAQKKFDAYSPHQVAAISYNAGTYIEVSGAQNYELITKSLENIQSGIRLMNVRKVIVGTQDEKSIELTRATVFVPKGKENVFLSKIAEYAKEVPDGEKPKNNNLVSSIEEISDAIKISAFWTGNPSEMPDNTVQWFELWIDYDESNLTKVKSNIFTLMKDLKLDHRPEDEVIEFPERLIVPVYANRTNLLDLIKQTSAIAEIRKPADPNVFFIESTLSDQAKWADDLLARTHFEDTGVTICILDTGINNNHSLIAPYMPVSGTTVNPAWGTADIHGHGTSMAGIALYNDLRQHLIASTTYMLNHTIESVKIYEPHSKVVTNQKLYGAVTKQAAYLAEIDAPNAKRIYCMAITSKEGNLDDGQPSSWSGAIDQISAVGDKRLFVLAAGNVELSDVQKKGYPMACLKKSVEDPAQAWNAITVGAYTKDVAIKHTQLTDGYSAVAQFNELSPYSSTSTIWESKWPIKPDVVCDGGNAATDGTFFTQDDELSKLTLSNKINRRLFDTIHATSAGTAQCSYIAAELLAYYPEMRLETVRALLIHSARWTDAMKNQFCTQDNKTQGRKILLRACGYGVPDLGRAKDTLNNRVNMIIEGEMQPYEKVSGGQQKTKEMHLHQLPWPEEILQLLENTKIVIRITLSYFIEPGPGQKGWKNKYRYPSCGLRFDIQRPHETVKQFQQRINKRMRDHDYQSADTPDNNWYLGTSNRDVGSIHSDTWKDTAINLSKSGTVAVYPVIGWWRERTTLGKCNSKVRYSLIVSIESPEESLDLYTPIMTKIDAKVPVPIALSSGMKL